MDIHNAKNTRKSGKHKITKKQFKTSKQGTIYQKKKTQILSTTQKQDNKQHIFYIVDCYVKSPKFLNRKYLYNHLVNAGLIPDKSMAIISRRYDTLLKKLHITMMELCTREKKIKPLSLEDGLVKADVFFYIEGNPKLDQIFYKYHSYFSNTLSNEIYNYINKDRLYDSIVKYNPGKHNILKYFIKVFMFSNQNKIIFPGNYILRPTNSFAGKDILYIHNKHDLTIANKYYSSARNYKNKPYNPSEITVSDIITDLALFRGRKFHVRMYYIVSYINGVVNSFLFDIGEIFTAKSQFNTNIPFSKEVHDSHGTSTDSEYFFPKDFNDANINLDIPITTQMLDVLRAKCKIICSSITSVFEANKDKILFENQDNGYYVYGLDIFVKSNFEPVIIEINNNPGFGMKNIENSEYMSKILFGWINEIVIEPFFKYNKPQLARKHPTYIEMV